MLLSWRDGLSRVVRLVFHAGRGWSVLRCMLLYWRDGLSFVERLVAHAGRGWSVLRCTFLRWWRVTPTVPGHPAPERRASAAPLAGVWSVEDMGQRQVPANCVRPTVEAPGAVGRQERLKVGGCGGANRPVAVSRVDRAQPTHRASGVRCTPWLGGAVVLVLLLSVINRSIRGVLAIILLIILHFLPYPLDFFNIFFVCSERMPRDFSSRKSLCLPNIVNKFV